MKRNSASTLLVVLQLLMMFGCKKFSFRSEKGEREDATQEKPSNDPEGIPGYKLFPERVQAAKSSDTLLVITGAPQSVVGDRIMRARVTAWKVTNEQLRQAHRESQKISLDADRVETVNVNEQGGFNVRVNLPANQRLLLSVAAHEGTRLWIAKNDFLQTAILKDTQFLGVSFANYDSATLTQDTQQVFGSCDGNFLCEEYYGTGWEVAGIICPTGDPRNNPRCGTTNVIARCAVFLTPPGQTKIIFYYTGFPDPMMPNPLLVITNMCQAMQGSLLSP